MMGPKFGVAFVGVTERNKERVLDEFRVLVPSLMSKIISGPGGWEKTSHIQQQKESKGKVKCSIKWANQL